MNGPDEQDLKQISRSVQIHGKLQKSWWCAQFDGQNFVTIERLETEALLNWCNFESGSSSVELKTVQISELSWKAMDSWDTMEELYLKAFANNMVAVGISQEVGKNSFRMMIFQYNRVSDEVMRVADDTIEIDAVHLAQLPCSPHRYGEVGCWE